MSQIPWHDLAGFAALWILGYVCYQMGRRFEEDKWVRLLIGFAQDIDQRNKQERDRYERIPR